ncbi:DUF1385 domain-containing protein [Thermincola potens]|uniref:DUF1385 domain-containing protein n=1 Tax=Thermincola potens (strain JR) TaxID=635013 RepID=D5XDJ2_THEPJ|nr:DUF1385 domain-containing protein [Thermincola potens]ADG83738.1 protein of unknown function DUF1385 [Thermincola potens JR]
MSRVCQYGGQAVIEGVMMRGPKELAIAVRKEDDSIVIEERPIKSITDKLKFLKWPFLRGVIVLFESMIIGIQALTFSANQAVEEEEEELSNWELGLTIAVALVLGILLFVVAPTTIARFLYFIDNVYLLNFLEGLVRISIFLLYVTLISRMKDIQRVFQYHGAEHKVIHAYEYEEELTVENVRKYSTLHPRCGTSFLLIVMVIMIFLYSFLGKPGLLVRIVSRIALLPIVAGISYEIIKLSGKYSRHPLMKIIIAPGLWLQKLTTREPDDAQIEVAIKALKAILPEEKTVKTEEQVAI